MATSHSIPSTKLNDGSSIPVVSTKIHISYHL